jgi:hypothetical protein
VPIGSGAAGHGEIGRHGEPCVSSYELTTL